MMSSSVPYTVPKQPGTWRAIFLAILVHAILFGFLWVGINWVNSTPETIEAEVWSTRELEQAPPPPVQPPPQPEVVKPQPQVEEKPEVEKPDIALEQEKKRKQLEKEKQAREEEEQRQEAAAQKKQEDDKKKKLADEKRKQDDLDAKKMKQLADAERKRILGETTDTGTSGTAAHSQGNGKDASWIAKVKAKIRSNINVDIPPSYQGNDAVEFAITLFPDGSIASVKKTKSSDLPGFDEAARRAIDLAAPYPADSSGVVPHSFSTTHKPKDK